MTHTPRLFVPAITPYKRDLSVDTTRFVAHSRRLPEDGADCLACFGSTSEATSMSVAERIDGLDALVAAGISAVRLIPGIKATVAERLDDPGHAILRPSLMAMTDAHRDQIANTKPLCFKGVPSV